MTPDSGPAPRQRAGCWAAFAMLIVGYLVGGAWLMGAIMDRLDAVDTRSDSRAQELFEQPDERPSPSGYLMFFYPNPGTTIEQSEATVACVSIAVTDELGDYQLAIDSFQLQIDGELIPNENFDIFVNDIVPARQHTCWSYIFAPGFHSAKVVIESERTELVIEYEWAFEVIP